MNSASGLVRRSTSLGLAAFLGLAATFGQAPPATRPASAPLLYQPDDIAQRLDAVIVNFAMESSPVSDVIQRLSDISGVPIRIKKDVLPQLPWGAKTKVSTISVSNSSLRDTLTQLLSPLGLQYKVTDDGVMVSLVPALDRMENRATWNDLKFLQKLMTTPFSPDALDEFKIQYRFTAKVDGPALLEDQLTRSGKGSVAQMLETATASLGWAWVPEDDHIVIITKQASIARNLSAKVTGHYEDRRLGDILFELGREGDVHIHLQPGTFKVLSESVVEHYSLRFENASIRQALDFIVADTGLAYKIENDGVHIGPAPDIAKRDLGAAGDGDPYVAKLSIPVKDGAFSYEFLVRESDLPGDVISIRNRAIKDFIREARRNAPASQPASQPASRPAASTQASAPALRP